MKISIVVPTYNEENDIRRTLDCLVNLVWSDYEVIVVDDSTDMTPIIVKEYEKFGVKLIKPDKRDGRCGARNIGILESTGEVVVILNADVLLPKNFLKSIVKHYESGADYVLVRSIVENIDDLFARYVECVSCFDYYDSEDLAAKMEWTEGFSCRRSIAIEAGLFPAGFPVALCAGEDGFFGDKLKALGAYKIIDLDIVCTHVAPARLSEYWTIRKSRGEGSSQSKRYLKSWSYFLIGSVALLRATKTILLILSIFPVLYQNYLYAKKSSRGQLDLIPFCWAWIIEQIAFTFGELSCFFEIIKIDRKLNRG